ncbi:autotransporter assembly complex protein TamA [Kordiimonas sp.]|uniref:autotransporter assembly complex protein TamA n=1 Tax=Kordiimonas sp. TaxID=1970157 RepID=UPI003A8FC794
MPTQKHPGANSVRATLAATFASLLLTQPLTAQPSCGKSGFAVGFTLDVPERQKSLRNLLLSVSRLEEKDGDCVASLARVDSSLDADIETFRRVLKSEGYYNAVLDSRVENAGDNVSLVVFVRPGPRYGLEQITTTFIENGSEVTLENAEPSLIEGQTARSEDIVAAEQQLLNFLGDQGYPFALADERQVIVDHATRGVAVHYRIDTGPKLRFGAIQYQGLERTEASYLDRMVPWMDDELIEQSEVNEFRKRLMSSGLFRSTSVTVERPENTAETAEVNHAPIAVKLEEAPPRRVELGAGYSTGEGFDTEASWSHRNAWGRGENLKLSARVGESEQTLRGDLRKPHFRRYEQTLNLTARLGRENTPAYKAHLIETFAGLERRLNERLVASVGISGKATQERDDGVRTEYVIAGLPLGLGYDSTNSLLDPKNGFRAHMRVQPNQSLIGDSFFFLSNELKASAYWTPGENGRVTLAARVRAGATFGAGENQLPLSERFFAGGGGSVRGFSYQDLGPKDDDGDPLGGRSVAELAVEARVRVSESISLVPFLDGGAVYNTTTPDFGEFRWGTGMGVRYHTSVAPVRLDVAFPLGRREGESAVAVYLSVGQAF